MAFDFASAAAAASGFLGYKGGKEQNAANAQQAANQMAFQERMSNTSHVREVKDLKKAGLNPMLSTKLGGSSTPGGAQARMENTKLAGSQAAMASAQIANLHANTEKTSAEASIIGKTGQETATANLDKILKQNVAQGIKNKEAGELLKFRLQKLNFSVGLDGQRFTGASQYEMKVRNEFQQLGQDHNLIHYMNTPKLEEIREKTPVIYQLLKFRQELKKSSADAGIAYNEQEYWKILKIAGFGSKVLSVIGGKLSIKGKK